MRVEHLGLEGVGVKAEVIAGEGGWIEEMHDAVQVMIGICSSGGAAHGVLLLCVLWVSGNCVLGFCRVFGPAGVLPDLKLADEGWGGVG